MSRQIVFDTETTGLEYHEHRIIEIGAIELRNRRVVGTWQRYLNPDRDSDPGALEVHGLTSAFLADKPRFPQVVDDLVALLRGAEIIIHNAAFDIGFVDKEFERAGRPERIATLCDAVTDTWKLAKRLYPGQKASLDALCKRHSVDNSHRDLHGALLDARLLAEVYLAMTGGQSALGLMAEDPGSKQASAGGIALVDSDKPLRVIGAADQELAAHRERLAAMAKKGKLIWKAELDA